jgi:hypothetical protein
MKKEDGIFFMNDTDFFKYFTHVEICYILFNSATQIYPIEGEQNLRNASVFNIQTEGDGFLSVSVLRKTWRANRELRDKILPTHISIVKYDPKPKSRLKTFSDYNGIFESFQTPTLNVKVVKGNYLIYVYRDYDHAQFTPENTMKVKITCSAKFKHAQMSYDDRNKGFPLLQNIILQAEFIENNYNPDKGEDFDVTSNQLRGNGIGHIIFYISTPGYYLDFTGGTSNVRNYIMLSPYLNSQTTTFHRAIPSGKYLVLLGLMNGVYGSYSFNCFSKAYTTNRKLTAEYDNLVVLRGVSKFYAAPGLRLGYAITSSERLKSSILNSKDPWSINSVAEKAGIIMFSDTEYQANVRDYTAKEMEYFKNTLEKTGKFIFYPSQANFYLIELTDTDKTSTDVFVHLVKQNLMIRDLSSFPYLGDNYIRIAMLNHEDNERLANALISYV